MRESVRVVFNQWLRFFCIFSSDLTIIWMLLFTDNQKWRNLKWGEKMSFARPWSNDVSVNKGRKYISSSRHNAKIVHSTTQYALITQGRQNVVKTPKDEIRGRTLYSSSPSSALLYFFSLFQFPNQYISRNIRELNKKKKKWIRERGAQGKDNELERKEERKLVYFAPLRVPRRWQKLRMGKISPDCHMTFPVVIARWRPFIRAWLQPLRWDVGNGGRERRVGRRS